MRSTYHRVPMAFEYLHGQIDFSLDVKCNNDAHGRKTTGKSDVRLLLAKRNWGQHTFVYSIFKDWNNYSNSNLGETECEITKTAYWVSY